MVAPVTRRLETDHAVEVLPTAAYRGPLWHAARSQGVSASEVAAVVGLSRYDSRFNLWWHKRLGEGGWEGNSATNRGRRIEPLILEDFAEAHPEFDLVQVGLLQSKARPYQLATPDAVAVEHGGTLALAAVEAKTAGGRQGWGEPGSGDIPVDYRCQVLWQMDVLGVDVAFVPVWFGFDYQEYVVEFDADDAEFLRDEARAFLASLEAGQPPPLDSHERTTDRLRSLHPTVKDEHVEIPETLVRQYQTAQRLRDAAQQRMDLAENRIRALMGPAARAVVPDQSARGGLRKVASRSVYDVAASVIERNPYTVDRLNVSKPRNTTPRKVRR